MVVYGDTWKHRSCHRFTDEAHHSLSVTRWSPLESDPCGPVPSPQYHMRMEDSLLTRMVVKLEEEEKEEEENPVLYTSHRELVT